MPCLQITGGKPLVGEIHISGSKNESLPLLCASLLTEETVLHRVPNLSDTQAACSILRQAGCTVTQGYTTRIAASRSMTGEISADLMGRMRSSVLFLAPLLFRCQKVSFTQPGGCDLGGRPIDLHLSVLQQMGATFHTQGQKVQGFCKQLTGADITLPYPSVGATETALMAASVAKGSSVLRGCAKEPEITALIRFLIKAGAGICRSSTGALHITPMKSLTKVSCSIGADRIETATWMCAAQTTGGTLLLRNTDPTLVKQEISVLRQMGACIRTGHSSLLISGRSADASVSITTGPWPGIPTDAGPLLAAAGCKCKSFEICETVFADRFSYIKDFTRMGVSCTRYGNCLRIAKGDLCGAQVTGYDLRAAAALLVLSLGAKGKSMICGVKHLHRGYELLYEKLVSVGADCEECL